MTLYMQRMEFDLPSLYQWAENRKLPTSDSGYLVHAALRAALGAMAPQPFAVTGGRGRRLTVLGYGGHAEKELREALQAQEDPALGQALSPGGIAVKTMPDRWPKGERFAFRVSFCPVVRRTDPEGRRQEYDVFLSACRREPDRPLVREEVYLQWLAGQLGRDETAELVQGRIVSFRLVTPVRRRQGRNRPRRLRGRRPSVVTEGFLRVRDPGKFASLLARGVGRHRAFGYGMLLLRPA